MRIAINLENIITPNEEFKDVGIEAVKRLSTKHKVLLLYTPHTDNVKDYSEKALWVKENLGEKSLKDFIITPNKTLILCDFLIDSRNYKKYRGTHLKIYDGIFPTWNYILSYLSV